MRPPNFDPNPYWLAPYDWLTSFQGWDPLEVDIIFFVPQTMQWLVITFPINQGKSGYTHIIPYPWLLFIGNVMIFTIPDWNIPSLDTYPWANSEGWWLPRWWNSQCFFTNAPSFFGTNTSGQNLKISHFLGPQEIGYGIFVGCISISKHPVPHGQHADRSCPLSIDPLTACGEPPSWASKLMPEFTAQQARFSTRKNDGDTP